MNTPEIQAIRDRYKKSLPEKAELIEEQRQSLVNSNVNAYEQLHSLLHKLAGSSGMYGYDDIAALCRSAMVNAQNKDKTVLDQKLKELISMLIKHAET